MKQRTIIAAVAVVISGMLTGCAAHSEKKQAIVERWEKSAAQAKLPTVENLIERGRIAEAEKTLRECLQTEPTSAQAHFLMGRVHLIENRTDDARISFAEAITLDASYDAAWYHLAMLFDLDGNSKRAMEACRMALSLKPAESEYIVGMARLYMQADQVESARELLEDRLKSTPGDRDLLLAMADLNRSAGQLDKTVSQYERILAANAKDTQVLEALGYTYVALKDWDRAIRTFDRLLNAAKEEAQKESTLDILAMCAFKAERYGQALKYYDRLSVARRDDAEVWLNMAESALGADLVERAALNAQRALQLKPSWPRAYAVLGSAQYLLEQYDAALRSFSYARSDDQVGGFAWFLTGRCYARLGQTAKADAAYQKAGDLAADSPLINRFLKEEADSL